MPKLKNAFVSWRNLRDGGPWSTTGSGRHRHTDRMILAIAAWCCSWAAGEFVLAEPERVFNPYGVGYIAGAILTGLSACYVVSRLVSRGYAFTSFTAALAAGGTLTFATIAVAAGAIRLFTSEISGTSLNTLSAAAVGLILITTYVAVAKCLKIRGTPAMFLASIPLASILIYGQVARLSIWYTLPATSNESGSDGYGRISVESIYYGQYSLMDAALDKVAKQRPGIADIYFVGFAGDASQKVFLKEARSVGQLFDERFDTASRSMLLINNRATVYETPLANGNNLWYGLKEIGKILDPEEDVLFLFLTSHGSKDLLSVNFWPLQPDNMTAEDLRKTLDDSGIKWRVIVVSACYSGSFIDDLRTDHSLIITAAHADRTSFGCGDEFDFTYFGRAYFDQALRETFSFIEAFGTASKAIEQRESEEGLTPSQPQIDIGSAIRPKLEEIGKRLAQLHKDQVKIGAHGLSGQARE